MSKKSSLDKLDRISLDRFGRKRSTSLDDKICVMCGGDAQEFESREDYHEYLISAACQTCQNYMDEEEEGLAEEKKEEELWC